jgi:4-amino-4-deoxy-L-arabinose transferase-like glycosyltransferase
LSEISTSSLKAQEQTKLRASSHRDLLRILAEGRYSFVLGAVVIFALAIRIYGNSLSLPYVPHPDEPAVVDRALAMLRTGDYDPHSFIYPTLYTYLQLFVYVAQFLWGSARGIYHSLADLPTSTAIITTAPGFYVWGRVLTAVLGAGTVLVVYRTGARLYGVAAGLVGALLLTFSLLHSEHSHYITVDVPAAFFSALAFMLIAELYVAGQEKTDRGLWKLYLLAGLSVGLAVGTKYNAVVIVVPLLLAHLFVTPRARWLNANVLIGASMVVVGFLASSPFALSELPQFLNDVASIVHHYKFAGHPGYEGTNNWLYYMQYFWSSEMGPSLLAAAGILLCLFRHRRRDMLLLLFPLLYFAGLSSYKVNFLRNLLPMVPFMALLGGVFAQGAITWLSERLRFSRLAEPVVPLVLVGLVVIAPAGTILDGDRYTSLDDSRVLAERWVQANVSPAARIMVELNPVQWHNYPAVSAENLLINHPLDWYLGHGYQYLIASSDNYGDFLRQPDKYPDQVKAYNELFQKGQAVAEFAGKEGGGPGPKVTILKLNYAAQDLTIPFKGPVRFGPNITLLGYDIGKPEPGPGQSDGRAAAVFKPGETVNLTFYWQADRPVTDNYKVFVHLLDSKGTTVAQRDTPPLTGSYPTSQWRQGELVIDPAPLAVPASLPPGDYTLEIGLYQETTMARLPVTTPDGKQDMRYLLAPIEVK